MVVDIATDGVYRNNQTRCNIGAWGIIVAKNDEIIHQDSGVKTNTTNNQMELTAFIKALDYILEYPIKKATIIVDSAYIYNTYSLGWILNWEKENYMHKKQLHSNTELWKESLLKWREIKDQRKNVDLQKIKGHSSHQLNILVDSLCNQAMNNYQLDSENYGGC